MKKGDIKFIEISKDIYACMVEDNGIGWSNAGFINKGKGMLIDTMYDLNFAQKLKNFCLQVSKKEPSYVINTHGNGDHMWGNQIFEKADIIGHTTLLEDALRESPQDFQKLKNLAQKTDDVGIREFAKFIEPFDFTNIKTILPNITFEKSMNLNLEGTVVELIHVGPAHTRGDVMAWLPEEKVLFSGDIVFNKCTPICWLGIGMKNWIQVLNYIIYELKPKTIVPGHGPLCSTEEVIELKEYMEHVVHETEKYYKEGIKDPLDICRKINLERFIHWTEPERLYINVNAIIRDFNKDSSPINFIEISRAAKVYYDYLKNNGCFCEIEN